MVNIIKRGGFREQAARQLKYKNSVNQRAHIRGEKVYQPSAQNHEAVQDNTMPSAPEMENTVDEVSPHSSPKNDST